jgi:23S rRNA (cytidine1920-2'-O)/16S rRNA (cytidine1409-2'-O)-methyltransferase
VNLERTNLRELDQARIPDPIDLVTIDLSYVALTEALPQLGGVALADGAELIALVKPTFELRSGRLVLSPNGIEAARSIAVRGAEAAGWLVIGTVESPVPGGRGARELFLYGRCASGSGGR